MRVLKAFGRFWWDFLVGDTPEIAVGVLVVLGIAALARHHSTLAAVLVPVAVALLLAASTFRGRRQ